MNITYNELLEYLKLGDEIEFKYKNKKYSINCGQKNWYLTEYYSVNQEFSDTNELLKYGRIDGKTIKEVWNDVEVTAIF